MKGKLNGHLMASFVRNIRTKDFLNLVIGFQVTVENVGDAFWDTVYMRAVLALLISGLVYFVLTRNTKRRVPKQNKNRVACITASYS